MDSIFAKRKKIKRSNSKRSRSKKTKSLSNGKYKKKTKKLDIDEKPQRIFDTSQLTNISDNKTIQNGEYRQLFEGLEKRKRLPLANKYVNSNLNHIRKSYCGTSIKRKLLSLNIRN